MSAKQCPKCGVPDFEFEGNGYRCLVCNSEWEFLFFSEYEPYTGPKLEVVEAGSNPKRKKPGRREVRAHDLQILHDFLRLVLLSARVSPTLVDGKQHSYSVTIAHQDLTRMLRTCTNVRAAYDLKDRAFAWYPGVESGEVSGHHVESLVKAHEEGK